VSPRTYQVSAQGSSFSLTGRTKSPSPHASCIPLRSGSSGGAGHRLCAAAVRARAVTVSAWRVPPFRCVIPPRMLCFSLYAWEASQWERHMGVACNPSGRAVACSSARLTGPAGPGCRGGAAALTMVGGKTLVVGATGKVAASPLHAPRWFAPTRAWPRLT
jgi:hypothetical protein